MYNTKYRVIGCFDTETSTVENMEINEHLSFTILYILNIFKDDISEYEIGKSDDISFFRFDTDFLSFLDNVIKNHMEYEYVPIICSYNLFFDLQSIMHELQNKFVVYVSAKSGTSIYTMDLYDLEGNFALRFWDVSYLDPRGLDRMGDTVGFNKTKGWNYSLVRHNKTVLTDEELEYAKRDVQIIPAYLRYILETNDFLKEEDLGCKLLTKTSLIRLYGKRVIGKIKDEKNRSVYKMHLEECERERPKTWNQYAIRKACGRGGLAFTSALFASTILYNVFSIDVVSMHHAFMRRYVPCKFVTATDSMLDVIKPKMEEIRKTSVYEVLEYYHNPFDIAFNVCVHVHNVRLKSGTVFDDYKIATLAISKIYKTAMYSAIDSESKAAASEFVFENGYRDRAKNTVEAYGKLYEAEEAFLWFTEIEWWIFSQVYDFTFDEVVKGEVSYHSVLPPDLIILMSSSLFSEKQSVKEKIRLMKDEKKDVSEIEMYYQECVKPKFNAIYGTQVQDVNKPSYKIEGSGEIIVDLETLSKEDNMKKQGITNFNYGTRIVAGSRMHLVIAMILIYEKLGDKVKFLGGDTDSLKFSLDGACIDDVMNALEPLHNAVEKMIKTCSKRAEKYGIDCSIPNVGKFQVDGKYEMMVELWNKCRIGIGTDGKIDFTCSGIARPLNVFSIEDIGNRMLDSGIKKEEVISLLAGYNTTYMPSVSFMLGHSIPKPSEKLSLKVRDYKGKTFDVSCYKAISLYPIAKTIGDLVRSNIDNISFKLCLGQKVDTEPVLFYQDEDFIYIEKNYNLIHKIKK